MVSKIHIWNQALGYIGTRSVAGEDEACEEARQCALYWDTARRAALRDFPYNFAQCREVLARKPLPPEWSGQWACAFALPERCLKLHRLDRGQGEAVPFRLVYGQDGPLALCDLPRAHAEYTRDVPDTGRFDPAFVQVMARKLAAMIAVPLLKNNSAKVNELEQLYRAAVPQAFEASASERRDKDVEDSWISCR